MLKFKIVLCFLLLFSSMTMAATWIKQYEDTNTIMFVDIHGRNSVEVYACGSSGKLVRTLNRGVSWEALSSGTTDGLNGISVLGSTIRVVTSTGKVRTTTNEGASWSETQITAGSLALNDIWFVDASNGFLAGINDGIASVWQTTNGGSTWTGTNINGAHLYSVHGTDINNVWVAGGNGNVSKWNGSAWTSVNVAAYSDTLRGVHAESASTVWVVGAYSAVAGANAFLTTNGGTSWTPIKTANETYNLMQTWFVDVNNGWSAGDYIYYTVNGGATNTSWTWETTSDNASLAELYFTDANNGWAVGNTNTGGIILKRLVSPEALTVTPTSAAQGATKVITIEGTNFLATPSLSLGSGVTVNSVTFNSLTSISANISVSSGAVEGTRDVTVTNPDGGVGVKSAGFRVTTSTGTSETPGTPGTTPTTSETVVSSPQVNSPGATINVSFRLSSARSIVVQILNQGGAVVARRDYSGSTGANQLEIPSAGLPAGVYLYQIIADGAVQSQGWFVIER